MERLSRRRPSGGTSVDDSSCSPARPSSRAARVFAKRRRARAPAPGSSRPAGNATPAAFRALAERGGWRPEKMWLDQQGAFSLHLLRG